MRYGHYLIGLNTTKGKTFELTTPPGLSDAPDLVSGKTLHLNAPVRVGPRSSVVLDLGK
ncbi:hypothetical protein [Limnoglobus roseus]|uniref:hypothetical protein n=1 Tax=Limnoglobus roseus TaxID=2598579 RepID=UPI00143DA921|nr:hypothetical protein [Limnoglobus roseus]